MREYDRDEYEEEYDDYEDEGDGYEEAEEGAEEEEFEEEEEEERKPTEEELEYLELRKRLKERIRKKIKKENGSTRDVSQEKKRLPYDNYGSFFGPSQPIISQRVIQESKSLLENQHLACMVSNSHHSNRKTSASNTTASKAGGVPRQLPKVNPLQKKVEKIKVSRDYSFLSDDAEPPAPKREPPAPRREPPAPRREPPAPRREPPAPRREPPAPRREPPAPRREPPAPRREPPAPRRELSAPRREPSVRNGSLSNSEARSGHVPLKSKQSLGSNGRNINGVREERKPVSSNGKMHSNGAREERRPSSSNALVHSKGVPYKPSSTSEPNLTLVDSRKQQHINNNGVGPGRPAAQKSLTSKMPVGSLQKKVSAPGSKSLMPNSKTTPSSKILPSMQKKPLEQRKVLEDPRRGKIISKQPVSSSKPQTDKSLNKMSSRAPMQDSHIKKKPSRRFSDDEDGEDDAKAFSMLRSILGPRKYADYDDDDLSDMEAGFDDIMREEQRSALIARREDEEQLRLIEEEERQERMRKLAKKRKLSQQR